MLTLASSRTSWYRNSYFSKSAGGARSWCRARLARGEAKSWWSERRLAEYRGISGVTEAEARAGAGVGEVVVVVGVVEAVVEVGCSTSS
jgi:hypothetical protein